LFSERERAVCIYPCKAIIYCACSAKPRLWFLNSNRQDGNVFSVTTSSLLRVLMIRLRAKLCSFLTRVSTTRDTLFLKLKRIIFLYFQCACLTYTLLYYIRNYIGANVVTP
jgi:hypothetical protein